MLFHTQILVKKLNEREGTDWADACFDLSVFRPLYWRDDQTGIGIIVSFPDECYTLNTTLEAFTDAIEQQESFSRMGFTND